MVDPYRPIPFRLALFLQAVSTRLTGAQLEECLREVTHFTGVIETPPLDARQQQCVAAILEDPSMGKVYGYETATLQFDRQEARRMAARCRIALEVIHHNESHYDFKYNDLATAIEAALAEVEVKLP